LISVTVSRKKNGRVSAFNARNHGASEVCAAVSMLVLNAVNSVESFTDARFACEYDEDGGYINFSLENVRNKNAALLLDSMVLGLRSVAKKYGDEIELIEKESEVAI